MRLVWIVATAAAAMALPSSAAHAEECPYPEEETTIGDEGHCRGAATLLQCDTATGKLTETPCGSGQKCCIAACGAFAQCQPEAEACHGEAGCDEGGDSEEACIVNPPAGVTACTEDGTDSAQCPFETPDCHVQPGCSNGLCYKSKGDQCTPAGEIPCLRKFDCGEGPDYEPECKKEVGCAIGHCVDMSARVGGDDAGGATGAPDSGAKEGEAKACAATLSTGTGAVGALLVVLVVVAAALYRRRKRA